ncbi:hypothetical protein [Vampirovibrio sp.]|uniref:hypothetical protein n=1 Tax=Vampirovibrio sp. TaxID=2717857 RepID=UPI0035944968
MSIQGRPPAYPYPPMPMQGTGLAYGQPAFRLNQSLPPLGAATPQPALVYPQPLLFNTLPVPYPQAIQAPQPLQTEGIQFDLFRQQQCKPALVETQQDRLNALTLHPQQYQSLKAANVPEGPVQAIKMASQIMRALDPGTQRQFQTLLNKGVITQGKSDDGHSGLYHLYGILTTPRAAGFNNRTILKETVQVLSQPYSISQRFAPVGPQEAKKLMAVRSNPGLSGRQVPPPIQPLSFEDLNVDNSATCVASSVMYYMADKEPAGFARHINELTSPMNAFFEKAKFTEISPDNPAQALQILQEHQIPYYVSGPGEVTVKVENPPAGVVRATASQNLPANGPFRNAIGAAYQSAITYLVTHSYDPASDLRDADVPGETSKGLTEAEKTLMEAIIKDNGGVQSVTYQAVNNKANPAPGEENNSYLFGYNRPFEQTTQDILEALRMNEPVIIGTTDTDDTGAIVAGHEITITGAYTDPQDNQLKFVVADSDDNIAAPVVKSARDLIPTIHHAGLPVNLARRINQQIQANAGYLIPDQQDQVNFKLLAREASPMPMDPEQAQPAGVSPYSATLPGLTGPAPAASNFAPYAPPNAQAFLPTPIYGLTMPPVPATATANPFREIRMNQPLPTAMPAA